MRTAAVVYGAPAGPGGLGLQAASVLHALACSGDDVTVHALGPGRAGPWPFGAVPTNINWHEPPAPRVGPKFWRRLGARYWPGRRVAAHDRRLGRWAAGRLKELRPHRVLAFTQVALPSLRWCQAHGVPSVLDNPNTHIADFVGAYHREADARGCGPYRGHPTHSMQRQVEQEYRLVDRVRVSSLLSWARMMERGVPAAKRFISLQPLPDRFAPPADRPPAIGPLRVVYVGSLDLRKGFAYLLEALHRLPPGSARLRVVGATGDPCSRRLWETLSAGLDVTAAPGDPLPAYHEAELFVLPSLEDGFGFVAAEAMACGVPAVITTACGSEDWLIDGETGWRVRPGDTEALTAVLIRALAARPSLAQMGRAAAARVRELAPPAAQPGLAEWFWSG